MKTFWNKTFWIEQYILNSDEGRAKRFSTMFSIFPELENEVKLQQRVHYFLKLYHRKKLKQELDKINHQLMTEPEKEHFQNKIRQIFKF